MPSSADSLGELATQWTRVFEAQESRGDRAEAARHDLLVRYHHAVHRYFQEQLRDPHAAGKLFSNFALRVLEVHAFLRRADPERGRFRDYLRTILRRMVVDHYREQQREQKKQQPLMAGSDNEPAESAATPEEDQRFIALWRQELIDQAWKALEAAEQATGQPFASFLRYQSDHPGCRSADIAAHFTAVGKKYTAAGARQIVHRARERFGELLVAEVARSLRSGDEKVPADHIERELIELNLLFSYCKTALEKYA
ncbi:MAG: sigma-70 family RNA polymerase sigma factor [Planctomycetes bacterium]|nr:sigma-70 family RNA polymerase sigma factor [Planctomycetota bacterium]